MRGIFLLHLSFWTRPIAVPTSQSMYDYMIRTLSTHNLNQSTMRIITVIQILLEIFEWRWILRILDDHFVLSATYRYYCTVLSFQVGRIFFRQNTPKFPLVTAKPSPNHHMFLVVLHVVAHVLYMCFEYFSRQKTSMGRFAKCAAVGVLT